MKHTLRTAVLTLAVVAAGVGAADCGAGAGSDQAAPRTATEQADFRLRSDVEAALPGRAPDRGPRPTANIA